MYPVGVRAGDTYPVGVRSHVERRDEVERELPQRLPIIAPDGRARIQREHHVQRPAA